MSPIVTLIVAFVLGVFVGAALGVFVMALCVAAKGGK